MKHIFMVDDVTTNLKCAYEVLKGSYEVTTVRSGKQALEMLEQMLPDLILLDLNMPDMNGYELMKVLKEDERLGDIPVIIMTAETDEDSEIRGLKMGAMDFIRKPFDPKVMCSRIERVLEMTDQKKELLGIAQTDGLTELLNRRYMEKLLDRTGTLEQKGYFMLLDLDNFKLINDNYGHVVGDQVLICFAKVLKEEVGTKDTVCRMGGDEFAVFISGECETETIKTIARKMIAGIEFEVNELLADSCDSKVSVSVGIARKPEDGNDFAKLYEQADKALYFVKQNGKRGYHFYHDVETKGRADDENRLIDLLQLQRLIEEKNEKHGAYRVEYTGFKRIYHFVSRSMERKHQDVQLVLFTVRGSDQKEIAPEREEELFGRLETAVSESLRRGDVATKCGMLQYVVILIDATADNGRLVAERICNKFYGDKKEEDLILNFDMRSVEKSC